MDRHAVVGQAQHIGHRRIVKVAVVIGVLLGDRENPERGRLLVSAIEDHRRADLVARAEDRQGLCGDIDGDDDRTRRHARVVPHIIAVAERPLDLQHPLDHIGRLLGLAYRSRSGKRRLPCRRAGRRRRGMADARRRPLGIARRKPADLHGDGDRCAQQQGLAAQPPHPASRRHSALEMVYGLFTSIGTRRQCGNHPVPWRDTGRAGKGRIVRYPTPRETGARQRFRGGISAPPSVPARCYKDRGRGGAIR